MLGAGQDRNSMGVETKKMANSIATSSENLGDRVKAWPERIKSFYNDVRTETRKVTAPSWKEVQATTAVVVITVFIFGVYFFIVDNLIQKGVSFLYSYFGH
jgi:preprotein translocase subunit SecE